MNSWTITSFIKWRPNANEQRLLVILAGVALSAMLLSIRNNRDEAGARNHAATQRLTQARAQFTQLSDGVLTTQLLTQGRMLENQRLTDPTPEIARLRMQEELILLAGRAGLINARVVDAPFMDADSNQPSPPASIRALKATIEAEFDWAALIALLGALEAHYRGYIIDSLETRKEGDTRTMRIGLCALYVQPENLP